MKNGLILQCVMLSALMGNAFGQPDLDRYEKALGIISRFASDICSNPQLKGSSSSIQVNAAAKAEASKLVKQLADVNVGVGGGVGKEEYDGYFRKDLLEAVKNASTCKQNVFRDLKDQFLGSARVGSIDSSIPGGQLTVPFSSEFRLGMTKQQVAKLNPSVTYQLSSDTPPTEFFTVNSNFAGLSAPAHYFFKNGLIDSAKMIFESSSVLNNWEPRSSTRNSSETRSGVSQAVHRSQCKAFYNAVQSALLGKYSPPPEGLRKVISDDRAAIEKSTSDRVSIQTGTSTSEKGVFMPGEGMAKINFSWSEIVWIYSAERSSPGGGVIGDRSIQQLYCTLNLYAFA